MDQATRIPSLLALAMAAVALSGCMSGAVPSQSSSSAPAAPKITILYDAFGRDPAFTKDWGFAALIEVNGKRILFDTGDDPGVFEHNVRAAHVDLRRLDFAVISHRHSDHMGGLRYLLSINPGLPIYAPKEGFGIFGSSLPSTFYRRSDALPESMRYFDGQPNAELKFGTAWPGARFSLVDTTTQIAPGFTLIALVSDASGTKELRELSLAIDTPEGLILIVGCSHPGIEAILAEAARINSRIHLIAGGMHLVTAADPTIESVVTALHETWHVDWVAPGHCTGEPTFLALQRQFQSHYLYAGLGQILEAGAAPRAVNRGGETGRNGWEGYRRLADADRR